jgi:hypothetical protein
MPKRVARRMVEGASHATTILRRRSDVESNAPSTTLRSLRELRAVPLPRYRGGGGKGHRFSFHALEGTKEKGSGTPADALSSVPHQRVRSRHGKVGLRRPVRCRARSPAGVPPRLLPRRVSHPQGAARARLRGYGAIRGGLHAASTAPTSSDAPRTPVIVPAGMMPGPPGSGSQLRPRAPTSPRRPAMPAGRVLSGEVDSLVL